MNIEKVRILNIAKRIYEGNNFDEYIRKKERSKMVHEVRMILFKELTLEYPGRDFYESDTRLMATLERTMSRVLKG